MALQAPTAALSSAETEFISASAIVQEVIYLPKFLANLGYPQTAPTRVFAVKLPTMKRALPGLSVKHIDLRVHFVHEAHAAGYRKLCELDSKVNAADMTYSPRPLRLPTSSRISVAASWAT